MIDRLLSDDSYEAAENATGQGASNPFATEAITSGLQSQINGLTPANVLLTGGVSYSGTGFTYDVSALTYKIQGVLYASAAGQVTLGAADPTFDRIDVIYVDNTGTLGVLASTPSASPVKPTVDNATQLEISFVTVGAGATAPSGLTLVDVYQEDAGTPTEWAATANFPYIANATVDPKFGTYHISTNNSFSSNDWMTFTPAAPYAINGGNVNFWINPINSLSAPQRAMFVAFRVGGSIVGNAVQIGGAPFITYGFDPLAPLGTYQLVSIPISAFGALPATVDDIRIYKPGGPPNPSDFYLDGFQIQEGIPASAGGSVDASAVTYSPAVPSNWPVVPDDVAEALDKLAANAGGGSWAPTSITLGDCIGYGAAAALSAGAGYYYNFDSTSDDELLISVALDRNGLAYDGSPIIVELYWMKFGASGGTVGWELDYAFQELGDDAYSNLDGTETNFVDVTALGNQVLTNNSFAAISGPAGAKLLSLTLRRNSTGGGADTYSGDAELYGINLEI